MSTETILGRRSIRQYTAESVSQEQVRLLLEAAMSAPSAGNEQPWHFIVIREHALLSACADIHPHAGMAARAPLAVLLCADPALEKHTGFWPQDMAACTENLLLAAHAEGLGAVWVGIYPREERMQAFVELFGLPAGIVPFSLVPIGHPAEKKAAEDRFKSDRLHLERW